MNFFQLGCFFAVTLVRHFAQCTQMFDCEIFKQFFPNLLVNPDQFVLNFYELEPNPDCYFLPNPIIPPKSVVLQNSFHQVITAPDGFTSHIPQLLKPLITQLSAKEINIIVTSCPGPPHPGPISHLMLFFETFRILLFAPTSLFLVLGERLSLQNCKWYLQAWVYNQPASKLHIVHESLNIYTTLLLRLNPKKHPVFEHVAIQRLDNPVAFHEKYFSVYKERYDFTRASVMDRYHYLYYYHHNQNACFDLVYRPSKFCTYEIMAVLYLSEIHNMSFYLETLHLGHNGDLYEHITGLLGSSASHGQFSWENIGFIRYQRQAMFGVTDTKTLVYCDVFVNDQGTQRTSLKDELHLWISCFDPNTWIVTVLSVLSFTFVVITISRHGISTENACLRITFAFVTVLGILLGEESPPRKGFRFYVVMAFFGMGICQLYGNVTTSLTTVPIGHFIYSSLAEVVRAGFKILAYGSYAYFRSQYTDTFQHLGLSESDLNHTFQAYHGHIYEWLAKTGNQRYSVEMDMSTVEHTRSEYAMEIETFIFNGTRNGSVQCHNTKEHHRSLFLQWKVATVNRHWLMRSIQRMHDAGFRELWRAWFLWAAIKDDNLLSKLYSGNVGSADTIKLHRIFAIVILCACLFVTAGVIFICEVALGRRRTTIVTTFLW